MLSDVFCYSLNIVCAEVFTVYGSPRCMQFTMIWDMVS